MGIGNWKSGIASHDNYQPSTINCQLSTINCQLTNDLFSLCFNFDIRFLAATDSSAIAICRSSE
ncbi:MAG: hypothetical protein JGK01_02485 [Microcoleus sp. PH2017_03_ELD_O_A]|nr:hypothetical protein [Microcoleus sp. PH2017_04_SCI_O_A]MCC3440687.1 hypothetical protein [Microcoleus sp. PH2017_03_ELD_O_A]